MDTDITFPLPLALDRVMEGKPIAAHNSPLFKIPTEILAIIVSHLSTSKNALASLALVNSDCRQLARSCQFCIVKLDATTTSAHVLELLHLEAVERCQNNGYMSSLSLGACIRRIIVNNHGFWKELNAMSPDNSGDKDEQWHTSLRKLGQNLSEIYRPNALFVIPSLVHLESLDMSQPDWDQALLNSLTSCSIRQLNLYDVQMTGVVPVMDDSVVWPLETLNISLGWDFEYSRQDPTRGCLNASNNWNTILRVCSASLKVLKISYHSAVNEDEEDISLSLQFPQLQELDITWETSFDELALRSLIFTSPRLSTLVVNYDHEPTRKLLDQKGQIESLETLILHHFFYLPDDTSLEFLEKNPQLKAFAFDRPVSSAFIDRTLSLLAKFPKLTKLSMSWENNYFPIPNSSIDALSALTSLEVLHMSYGNQIGWRHEWWPIQHTTFMNRLKPLKKLRRIAFTRDIYDYDRKGQPFQYNDYSQVRSFSWAVHCRFMRGMAKSYAEAFPNLEFIHIGKLSFQIRRAKDYLEVKAIEDGTEDHIEKNYAWKSRMFGIQEWEQDD